MFGTLHWTFAIEPQYQGHWHLVPNHRSSNQHYTHNDKEKEKGNSNDFRTTVIRQKEPRYPQHIHSFLSRFSLQPTFLEVLSGLLRAAYWPLVFSFSSFSGLFWPGPFFPIFRQWIPKRCKGVHCVDLGESFPTRIYLQKSASIQPRTSPSKFGGKIQFNIHFTPYWTARWSSESLLMVQCR